LAVAVAAILVFLVVQARLLLMGAEVVVVPLVDMALQQ
jgi:hypothetical protein